jgi:hypothetical protein
MFAKFVRSVDFGNLRASSFVTQDLISETMNISMKKLANSRAIFP